VRLDLWALLLAAGIVAGTVALPLAVALVLASLVVSAGVAIRRHLVPDGWRVMAVLSPLFVVGGVGTALLHATAFDPLLEFAAIEPGEVVVVGRIISPPVPTKAGYRADVRIEHLWYKEKEVLRGGGIQVYAGDMRVGVGDRVQVNGELKRPEMKDDGFDYGRYLQTRGISGVVYAKGVWPTDEERGWVGQVHRRTDMALGYGLRPREEAVVRGMVLGDSSRLPGELEEAFRRSGITHVLR
jgi:competence protein ComEC